MIDYLDLAKKVYDRFENLSEDDKKATGDLAALTILQYFEAHVERQKKDLKVIDTEIRDIVINGTEQDSDPVALGHELMRIKRLIKEI